MSEPVLSDPIPKGGEGMDKTDWTNGAVRREAFARLTRDERLKYEIARELGLLDRVRDVGWAGLTAKETGRIGGLMHQRRRNQH